MFSRRLLAFPRPIWWWCWTAAAFSIKGRTPSAGAGNGLYARIYRAQRLANMGSAMQEDPR